MAAAQFVGALNKCNLCEAKAYCDGFDAEHLYFECTATTTRRHWFELRDDPLREQCDELLS